MVGKRHRAGGLDLSTKYGWQHKHFQRPWIARSSRREYRDDDEEAHIVAASQDSPVHQVRASGHTTLETSRYFNPAEDRRHELKKKILEGFKGFSLEMYRKSEEELKHLENRKVRNFYEAQNDLLDDWIEVDALVYHLADDVLDSMDPDADHDGIAERPGPLQNSKGTVHTFLPEDYRKRRANDEKRARWAININVIANVLVLVGKLISLKFSPSLSLIASTADSALDLLCTLIVLVTNKLVAWRLKSLKQKYPVGRRRLEPIGILVFSVIMIVSFVQILQESFTKLLPGGNREIASLPPVAIGTMAANAIVKGLIGLACLPIKTTQVQALVQDCKTDVYFNSFSLLFPLFGVSYGIWWLDPTGAVLLALYVVYDWADTCIQQVSRLTGNNVDDILHRKLMFLAYRFTHVVAGFKSLTAYHAGDGVWVELHVLLPEDTSLPMAHDISETLQYCYEGLQEVDRAFVAVDYSLLGPTGHIEEH